MKRLLIVDDALIMRKMIREVAEAAGWEVVGEAADGQGAVESHRELKPDLVTLDLVMPVMGGLDALIAIRADDPEARVIVVTALGQKEMVAQAIAAGAIDFIVKPFDRSRMIALLSKLAESNAP